MSPARTTAEAIREIGAGAIALRALTMGLLASAMFDEPIKRGVIVVAFFTLVFGEAALWAHRYFERKYGRY